MKTEEQILNKMKEVEPDDLLGTMQNDLVEYLSYGNAKDYLNEGVTKDKWDTVQAPLKKEFVLTTMSSYLDFAFNKAENERGLSAGRSMDHYYIWLWLIDEENRFGDIRDYSNYGLKHLEAIKQYLSDEDTSRSLMSNGK